MARALAQAGARVALTSRHRERAQATAAELGADAVGVELDVRDATSVSAAVDRAYSMLDRLDVLVNNAGIGRRTVNRHFMTESQPFWEVTPAGFRDVLETKATGTFLVARSVVPWMLSDLRRNLLDPAILGPPIVWLASPGAAGVHDQRIVASDFEEWLGRRHAG